MNDECFNNSSFISTKMMKLIYLDTSNLILLSETKKTNPKRFEDFIIEWKNRDFVLALSQIQLNELLKAKYQSTRSSHLSLLSDFLPFRCEYKNFFEREIIITLFRKGHIVFKEQNLDAASNMFSKKIVNQEELNVMFISSNLISLAGFNKWASIANQSAWKAKSTDTFHKTPKPRLSEMENTWFGKLGKSVFAKIFGIDLSNPRNDNKTMESLFEDIHFRIQLKSALKTAFGKSDKLRFQELKTKISLEECRGLWLRKEVLKNLLKANDFDPNNESDLDSVQYLPYVDIFVTDKRIVDKTVQVLRRSNLIESLKNTPHPRKTANLLESLEKTLFF